MAVSVYGCVYSLCLYEETKSVGKIHNWNMKKDENKSLICFIMGVSKCVKNIFLSISLWDGGENNNTPAYAWLKLNCFSFFNK